MTQEERKTMTSEEAWYAMALGKCVTSAGEVYRILNGHWLQSYDGRTWRERSCFDSGPYKIIEDPSQKVIDPVELLIEEHDKIMRKKDHDEDLLGKFYAIIRALNNEIQNLKKKA